MARRKKKFFSNVKEKTANLESIYSKEKLEHLEEADKEFWEPLEFPTIFSNQNLVEQYTETFYYPTKNESDSFLSLPCRLKEPTHKDKKKFVSLSKFWENNKDSLAQYVDSLINELKLSSREDDPEFFARLLKKRYFLLQQKYLSTERQNLRKNIVNAPSEDGSLTRPLEFFLDIMAPMLNAHAEIPLHISISSLKSISINKFDITNAIQKLHENLNPKITTTYPKRFIQSIKDWIIGLLNDILQTPEDDKFKFTIMTKKQCIEYCALALLNFGIETYSISCILSSVKCLELQCDQNLSNTKDFAIALKNLNTISNSKPDVFHTLNYYPVTKNQYAKVEKLSIIEKLSEYKAKEILSMVTHYTNDKEKVNFQSKEEFSQLVILFDNNTICVCNPVDNQYKHFDLQVGSSSNIVNSIVTINGIVYWYDKESDSLFGINITTGNQVIPTTIEWPESRGNREVASIFSEGEFIYIATMPASDKHTGEDILQNEEDQDIDDLRSSKLSLSSSADHINILEPKSSFKLSISGDEIRNSKLSLTASSDHINIESTRTTVPTNSPYSSIWNTKETILFKFKLNESEYRAQYRSISLVPTTFVHISPTSITQYITDGRWLLTMDPDLGSCLFSHFIEPYGDQHTEDPTSPHKATEFADWDDIDEVVTKPKMCWDLKYGIVWEYDPNDKMLSYTYVDTITPQFLLSKQQFSPQLLIEKSKLRIDQINSLATPKTEEEVKEEMELIEVIEFSGKEASLIILSSIDRIIQLHSKGAYVTEIIKGLFEEIYTIIDFNSSSFLKSNASNFKEFFDSQSAHGLLSILRITKVQISQCPDNESAIEVGLLSPNDEQTNLSVSFRSLLLDIVNHSIELLHQFPTGSEENIFLHYLTHVTAEILSSGLQIFYKPEELGQLVSSMDTNPKSYKVHILAIFLNQLSSILHPGLLITHIDKSSDIQEKPDPSRISVNFTTTKAKKRRGVRRMRSNMSSDESAQIIPFKESNHKQDFNNKVLQFLLKILGDDMLSTLHSNPEEKIEQSALVRGAASLLESIQGDLILRAWRDKVGERHTAFFTEFEKGGAFWLLSSYGNELLDTCISLLESVQQIENENISKAAVSRALQNPIFTELLPSFLYSFWVFDNEQKHVARILYVLLPKLLKFLEKLHGMNQYVDDIKKFENIMKEFYKCTEQISIFEIAFGEEEEADLVENVSRPGALYMKITFDPRSCIDENDDVTFYADSHLKSHAKIQIGDEIYYGKIPPQARNNKFPEEEIIFVGDTLYINFCASYYSKQRSFGIRALVTSYFPSQLQSYHPILDLERGIALLSSAVINQMINYSPQLISANQADKNQLKECQEWLDSPITPLHYGLKPDHFFEDNSFISSIIQKIEPGSRLISNLSSIVKSIIPNHPQAQLLDDLSRKIFACLIHHTRLVDVAKEFTNSLEQNQNPPTNENILKLWRSSINFHRWIIIQHQKADIQYDALSRSIHSRADFLLSCWSIFTPDLNVVSSIMQPIFDPKLITISNELLSSIEEFINSFLQSEIPLEVIKDIMDEKQKTCLRRYQALEIQQMLFNISSLPSIKKNSIWKLSPPAHILNDVNGAYLNDRLNLITQYSHFVDLLTTNISISNDTLKSLDIPLAKISLYLICFKFYYQSDIEIVERLSLFNIVSELINKCLSEIAKLREKIIARKFLLLKAEDKDGLITKLNNNLTRLKEIQKLYSNAINFYSIFASQCIGVNYHDFKVSPTIITQSIFYLIEILKKNILSIKEPEEIDFSLCDQLEVSNSLKNQIIQLWEKIGHTIFIDYAEQSSFDILTLVHSLASWGVLEITNYEEELTHILFQFIINGTPRLQKISLQMCSLTFAKLGPDRIESILSTSVASSSSFPIVEIFFIIIGKAISLEWDFFELEETIYEQASKTDIEIDSEEEDSNKPLLKKRKISSSSPKVVKKQRLSSPPREKQSPTRVSRSKSPIRSSLPTLKPSVTFDSISESSPIYQAISRSFFDKREMEERLWIAQELIYFLRSLLKSTLWKDKIADNLRNSISKIPNILKSLSDTELFKKIKREYETLVASLCIIGGNDTIYLERDIANLPKETGYEQHDEVIILEKIGEHSITSPITNLHSFSRLRNDFIEPIVRVEFAVDLVDFSAEELENMIKLLTFNVFESTKGISLLSIAQRAIGNIMPQLSQNPMIVSALRNDLIKMALQHIKKNSGTLRYLKTQLQNSKLSIWKSIQLQSTIKKTDNDTEDIELNSSIEIENNKDLDNMISEIKRQFNERLPYSFFHSMNFDAFKPHSIGKNIVYPIEKFSPIVPCAMKLFGVSDFSNEVINEATVLALTTVVWANYSIPPLPFLKCFYYEFEVKYLAPGGDVAIGVIDGQESADHELRCQIGSVTGSYAYVSKSGEVLCESSSFEEEQVLEPYGAGDIVGLGIIFVKSGDHQLFFTKNGEVKSFENAEDRLYVSSIETHQKYTPIIGLRGKNTTVEVNFGQKPFAFDTSTLINLNIQNATAKRNQKSLFSDEEEEEAYPLCPKKKKTEDDEKILEDEEDNTDKDEGDEEEEEEEEEQRGKMNLKRKLQMKKKKKILKFLKKKKSLIQEEIEDIEIEEENDERTRSELIVDNEEEKLEDEEDESPMIEINEDFDKLDDNLDNEDKEDLDKIEKTASILKSEEPEEKPFIIMSSKGKSVGANINEIQFLDTNSIEATIRMKVGDVVVINLLSDENNFYKSNGIVRQIDYIQQLVLVYLRRPDVARHQQLWVKFSELAVLNEKERDCSVANILDIERRIAIMQSREMLMNLILNAYQREKVNEEDHFISILLDNDGNFLEIIKLLKILFIQHVKVPIRQQFDGTWVDSNNSVSWPHHIVTPSFQKLLNSMESWLKYATTAASSSEKYLSILNLFQQEIFNDIKNFEDYPKECGILEMPISIQNKEAGTEKISFNFSTGTRIVCFQSWPFDFEREICIYADEEQKDLIYQYPNKHRPNIRINSPLCYLVKKENTKHTFQALPCDYLALEDNSDKNFNIAFVTWAISAFANIYNQTSDKLLSPIRSFIEDDSLIVKLGSIVIQKHITTKPSLVLLLCRLISVREKKPPQLEKLEVDTYGSCRILYQAMLELHLTLKYVTNVKNSREKSLKSLSTSSITITEDTSDSMKVDSEIKDANIVDNSEEKEEKESEVSEEIPIIDVVCCLLDNIPPTIPLAKKIISTYMMRSIIKESPHPYKQTIRDKVHIPNASIITVVFDPRCKLNGEDKMTFSKKRGARDLGELFMLFPLMTVDGDTFHYELKCEANVRNRLEYGFRFIAVPTYSVDYRNQLFEQKNLSDFPTSTSWNQGMYKELVSLALEVSSANAHPLNMVTVGDFIAYITDENQSFTNHKDFDPKFPLDPILYPLLHKVEVSEIQYRFALISILNSLLDNSNVSMEVYEEFWSIAHKIVELKSVIITNVKVNLLRNTFNEEKEHSCVVRINRRLAEESSTEENSVFNQVKNQLIDKPYILKSKYQRQPFEVQLVHEGAIDQGGPYRDCLIQLISDTQGDAAKIPLFITSTNSSAGHIPNPLKTSHEALEQFKFIGMMLAMCLRTGDCLPYYFANIVWKTIASDPISLSSFDDIDDLTESLKDLNNMEKFDKLNEENFQMYMCKDFTIRTLDGREVELIEGGFDTPVTWHNRFQYIKLAEEFRLQECSIQLQALKYGFLQIVSKVNIALFTWKELQERISGKKDIDVEYLKQNTEYDGFDENHPTIKYFWDTLRSFNNEQRSLFLRFAWGRTTLPPSSEEFEEKFIIQRLETDAQEDLLLPQSHTCSFQLELPAYSSEKVLREKLLYAITNCRDIDLEWRGDQDY